MHVKIKMLCCRPDLRSAQTIAGNESSLVSVAKTLRKGICNHCEYDRTDAEDKSVMCDIILYD